MSSKGDAASQAEDAPPVAPASPSQSPITRPVVAALPGRLTLPDPPQSANAADLGAPQPPNPHESKSSPDYKARMFDVANHQLNFWTPWYAGGIAVTFAFVIYAAVSFRPESFTWSTLLPMLAWRVAGTWALWRIVGLLKTAQSNPFAFLAALSVGTEWDRSTVIAKCGGLVRNLFMRPEQTTESLERERLWLKQEVESKRQNAAEVTPAPPPTAAVAEPKSASDKPVAGKKRRAAKKKQANRPRKS